MLKEIRRKKTFIGFYILCSFITLSLFVYIFGTIIWDYSIYKISILALVIMSTVCIRLTKILQNSFIDKKDEYFGE